MELQAGASLLDDSIALVSTLNKTKSVSFHLTNHSPQEAVFTTLIMPETQKGFVVSPKQGILHPYGSDGTRFQIDFTPCEYGKPYAADLIIDTDEMQWIYHLMGSFPDYKPPSLLETSSRIDSHISERVDESLLHKNRRNFAKENMSAVRSGPPGLISQGAAIRTPPFPGHPTVSKK